MIEQAIGTLASWLFIAAYYYPAYTISAVFSLGLIIIIWDMYNNGKR